MAKYIVIERNNGVVTIVRSEIETGSEDALTEHEQIINELFNKVKKLNKPAVMQQSELLNAFQEYYQSNKFDDERTFDWNMGKFLEAFNSA